MHYDPDHEPNRAQWFALDESERLALVSDYHRRARIKVPNLRAHAAMHVAVENQALLGDEALVPVTLVRLIDEGLDRHDAVHAIAFVLSGVMFDALKGGGRGDINAAYARELAEFTAKKWRAEADGGAGP